MFRSERVLAVRGNHEGWLLAQWVKEPGELKEKARHLLETLGDAQGEWAAEVRSWPHYRQLGEIDLVHAGLEPGVGRLELMRNRILRDIRTWDGVGEQLWVEGDPAWHEVVVWPSERTVVFGHWALQGLLVKPGFRGLDTGCLYGGKLTAWCAEEDRLLQVQALRAWSTGLRGP